MSKPKMQLTPMVREFVRGIFFRPGWYRSNYRMMERIFRYMEDPWNFEKSPYERERLELLLETVRRYPHERVLEVGCAEGIFTAKLVEIAREVVAIDVSPTAIARARRRAPAATYIETSIEAYRPDREFDLIVCAETLYYIEDVRGAIDKLSTLGRYTLVSYLGRELKNLDAHLSHKEMLEFREFWKSYGLFRRGMRIAVWENNRAAA